MHAVRIQVIHSLHLGLLPYSCSLHEDTQFASCDAFVPKAVLLSAQLEETVLAIHVDRGFPNALTGLAHAWLIHQHHITLSASDMRSLSSRGPASHQGLASRSKA